MRVSRLGDEGAIWHCTRACASVHGEMPRACASVHRHRQATSRTGRLFGNGDAELPGGRFTGCKARSDREVIRPRGARTRGVIDPGPCHRAPGTSSGRGCLHGCHLARLERNVALGWLGRDGQFRIWHGRAVVIPSGKNENPGGTAGDDRRAPRRGIAGREGWSGARLRAGVRTLRRGRWAATAQYSGNTRHRRRKKCPEMLL